MPSEKQSKCQKLHTKKQLCSLMKCLYRVIPQIACQILSNERVLMPPPFPHLGKEKKQQEFYKLNS